MIWCEQCSRSFEEEELEGDDCPECGEPLTERRKASWPFKFMIAATVVYLAYRTYQGVGWLLHHA